MTIGGHHSHKAATVEWVTPIFVLDALGGASSFDLDPCAPASQPWPTALRTYTKEDDGLSRPWRGRAWVNPPYSASEVGRWMKRLADHGTGTALIFARTETDAFFRQVWERAHGVLFLRGRLTFHVATDSWFERSGKPPLFVPAGGEAPGNGGAPSVLVAYGGNDLDILAACGLAGQFVPIIFPRGLMVAAIEETWRGAVLEYIRSNPGPVRLDALYRAFASHAKAKGNPNWRAKLRQTLQRMGARRINEGQWEVAA